jgi:hypothetical protein
VEGGKMEFETGLISQKINCTSCDREWWDVYRLVGVADDTGEEILSQTIAIAKLMRAVSDLMNDLSFHVQTTRFRPSAATVKLLERVRTEYDFTEASGVTTNQ